MRAPRSNDPVATPLRHCEPQEQPGPHKFKLASHCEPQEIPGGRVLPAPALLEHQGTLPHRQMLLGGPLLGASVTLGQFIVTQSEGHAPESKKSHAEAHQNQLCNILHVLQVFSRFQCGAMTRDSRLQGFVGPCVAWGSLTLQGGGHALHGAHSRIILDH